ncbi:Trans-aconitate 3-methyltransferase [Bertholletia excelsa]
MADLFHKQANHYAETRPSYPEELFQFIASKTPLHDVVWDVGTGSGQAAKSLAGIYKNVVATDTSQKQLDFAPKLPNIRYQCTPPTISLNQLTQIVGAESTVDLVTIAQALHWFDLPTFYHQVKHVLKKPHGVIAAWCYTVPEVNEAVDSVFRPFYAVDSKDYWDPARQLVNEKYRSIEFPFEPVVGAEHTGPFEFKTERLMDLDGYFTYIRSWSAYQTAKEKGVELLRDDVVENFKRAWSEDGDEVKVVKFPIHLKIGKVGNL